MNYEMVIGIEIHAQLKTNSKIFSSSSTAFGQNPNTQVSVVDAALPGALPVINKKVIELAVLFGLSVDAVINQHNVFARKNYFYPDLPKGYQISQMDHPIVGPGHIDITLEDGREKRIGITRAHLEEDAGKSIHEGFNKQTGIDLNRAGTPLLEIVSEPDMRTVDEAVQYCKTIHERVKYLGICDGNMQEGSFRCDINISLRPFGQSEFGTRTELKNLNSFRFIKAAIEHELERQANLLDNGDKVIQQTRLYDPDLDETRAMRSKENAHDYRYFPDPDLLPIIIDDSELERIKALMPELPEHKRARYKNDFKLNDNQITALTSQNTIANFFEIVAEKANAKIAANWISKELMSALKEANLTFSNTPISTEQMIDLVNAIDNGDISSSNGKAVFDALFSGENNVSDIIDKKQLRQMNDDSALEAIIDDIIANNPEQANDFRAGKTKLMAFFIGQVMKATKGQANPKQATTIINEKLN